MNDHIGKIVSVDLNKFNNPETTCTLMKEIFTSLESGVPFDVYDPQIIFCITNFLELRNPVNVIYTAIQFIPYICNLNDSLLSTVIKKKFLNNILHLINEVPMSSNEDVQKLFHFCRSFPFLTNLFNNLSNLLTDKPLCVKAIISLGLTPSSDTSENLFLVNQISASTLAQALILYMINVLQFLEDKFLFKTPEIKSFFIFESDNQDDFNEFVISTFNFSKRIISYLYNLRLYRECQYLTFVNINNFNDLLKQILKFIQFKGQVDIVRICVESFIFIGEKLSYEEASNLLTSASVINPIYSLLESPDQYVETMKEKNLLYLLKDPIKSQNLIFPNENYKTFVELAIKALIIVSHFPISACDLSKKNIFLNISDLDSWDNLINYCKFIRNIYISIYEFKPSPFEGKGKKTDAISNLQKPAEQFFQLGLYILNNYENTILTIQPVVRLFTSLLILTPEPIGRFIMDNLEYFINLIVSVLEIHDQIDDKYIPLGLLQLINFAGKNSYYKDGTNIVIQILSQKTEIFEELDETDMTDEIIQLRNALEM